MDGRVEEGKRYYVITHAYHHFLVEIVEMLGPQRARCKSVRKVHACSRGWTEFFAQGCRSDTAFMAFPPGELTWVAAFEWEHEIP